MVTGVQTCALPILMLFAYVFVGFLAGPGAPVLPWCPPACPPGRSRVPRMLHFSNTFPCFLGAPAAAGASGMLVFLYVFVGFLAGPGAAVQALAAPGRPRGAQNPTFYNVFSCFSRAPAAAGVSRSHRIPKEYVCF